MERLPDLDLLRLNIVTFAGDVIESQRPGLPGENLGLLNIARHF